MHAARSAPRLRARLRLLPLLVLASACLSTPEPAPDAADGAIAAIERFDVGTSVDGRPIEAISVGSGREVVLFVASIHGTEPAGTPLLERLADELVAQPELLRGRRVVLVPRANPDGLAHGRRGNANDVDLNRDFPSRNQRSAGFTPQPETRALIELIDRLAPARIVSVHQPLACIDWDGPAEDLARSLGSLGILGVRKLGSRPGSLGSWAGVDRRIPVITLELPGGAERQRSDQLWRMFGELATEAVRYRPRL